MRFSVFEPYYPLWIDVYTKEKDIIELHTSLRFRKPSELQRREAGNEPFKFVDYWNVIINLCSNEYTLGGKHHVNIVIGYGYDVDGRYVGIRYQ